MNSRSVFNSKNLKTGGCLFVLSVLLCCPAFAEAKPGAVDTNNGSISSASDQDPWGDDSFAFQDWNPSQSIRQMRQAMNQMLDWTEQNAVQGGPMFNQSSQVYSPALDVVEQPDKYLLKLDLPGMEKDKLDIRITEKNLSIAGERRSENEEKSQKGYQRFERSYGYFQRNIPIPENVKTDEVTAKYDRGVLEIVMPKRNPTPVQASNGRKISIA